MIKGIDGELIDGEYSLLCSNEDEIWSTHRLTSMECFEFLLSEAATSKRLFGYGIGLDVAHWIRDLTQSQKVRLAKEGMTYTELGLNFYRVSYRPNAYFRVDRLAGIPTCQKGRATVQSATITDLMKWHRKPFVDVSEEWNLGTQEEMNLVRGGKEARPLFTGSQFHAIRSYCRAECRMIAELATDQIRLMGDAGMPKAHPLTIGSVAGQFASKRKVQSFHGQPPDAVSEILPYAFHGGRMHVGQFGRFKETFHWDIRSAYGWAMAHLPDMLGTWEFVPAGFYHSEPWMLYLISWDYDEIKYPVMPFPHRDNNGYIHYPPRGRGWYWSPVVMSALRNFRTGRLHVERAIRYRPLTDTKPFAYMQELYDSRIENAGSPIAGVIKLLMVATWGRMCSPKNSRRPGHNKGNGREKGVTAGLLDWAGMTTALIQARILDAIRETGDRDFIACCVDGFFTKSGDVPAPVSEGLGEWSVKRYDELFLLRPAFYWAKRFGEWECKTSGLPASKETFDRFVEEWGERHWRGRVEVSQSICNGLLQCANLGDFTNLGKFEQVATPVALNPGVMRFGHICPSDAGMIDEVRWRAYWPPVARADAMSAPFKSRMDRSIIEEIKGEAISETSEG